MEARRAETLRGSVHDSPPALFRAGTLNGNAIFRNVSATIIDNGRKASALHLVAVSLGVRNLCIEVEQERERIGRR